MDGAPPPTDLLLTLARSRRPEDRERLMQALAAICDSPEAGTSERARSTIGDIFLLLVADAERDIRARLAVALAPARWAPSAIVNALALDDIEIARPIIAKSPVLTDPDLMRVLVEATLEHQIEVARRPHLAEGLVQAILERGDAAVMTALAGNETADVGAPQMVKLVGAARTVASLRTPLARHPRLTAELAYALYGWVGETLRQELGARFTIDSEALKAAMREAVGEAWTADSAAPPPVPEDLDRQEMETRLIAKLQAAGQLRPGYLLKALRDGKLYLFELALASLAEVRTEEVRAACQSDRPELVAMACASIGIDRSVFPTILSLLRALNNGRPTAGGDSLRDINAAFTHKAPEDARAAFRAGARALLPAAALPQRDRA